MTFFVCQFQLKGLTVAVAFLAFSGSTKDSVQTLHEKLEEGIAGKPQIFGGEDFWNELLTV